MASPLEAHSIVNAKEEHITQIAAISDKELGKGFLNYDDIFDKILDKDSHICKVALMDKRVAGFCLSKIINQSEICGYLRVDQTNLPEYVNRADKIGVLKTIAVNNDFHRHGIGYALTLAAYNDLITRDIQAISSIAWKNGEQINADKLLSALGLRPHIEIKSYWKADGVKNNYNCSACGPPPCKCSAVLYFRAI
jgi:ribosomal protein S18 acetylase RimI-like enzyme